MKLWTIGEEVELTVLIDGKTYRGVVARLEGLDVVVKLTNGKLYKLAADSPFVCTWGR